MGIGLGIVLIAVGAILTWAVTADAEGVDVNTVGVILMVVGAVALLLSLLLFESWSPYRRRRTTYVEGTDDARRTPPGSPHDGRRGRRRRARPAAPLVRLIVPGAAAPACPLAM